MLRLRLFTIVLPLLATSACSTYSVRRSALVPHMVPTTHNGQAMQRGAEASLGASTLAQTGAPTEAAKANAGLFIPRTQVNAAIRRKVNTRLDVGVSWDQGLSNGSHKASPDQPNVGDRDVYGGGMAIHYTAPTTNPNFSVGIATEFQLYSIPYVEYRTCIDNCPIENLTEVESGRSLTPVISLGITPSYQQEKWTFFGGITLRNHPTIEKGDIEGEQLINDDEVSAGDFNAVVNAGAEFEFSKGYRAMVHVYQPVTRTPIRYSPTIGIGITLPLSEE